MATKPVRTQSLSIASVSVPARATKTTAAQPAPKRTNPPKIASGPRPAKRSRSGVHFAGPDRAALWQAAQALAAELKIGLKRVDLTAVVSKYIGETEKNLHKLFAAAERSGAILFFDEADALFGKRSEVKDAHDKYANQEVSYLLQRLEVFDGTVILATTGKIKLPPTLQRRFTRVVKFTPPKPR